MIEHPALEAILQDRDIEVDEEPHVNLGEFQIGEKLRLVNR